MSEIEEKDHDLNYEDPKEVKRFARNLTRQIGQMQKEIKMLKNIRTAYFEILKGDKLITEDYNRKWSFINEQK